jgi:hypothetical protein
MKHVLLIINLSLFYNDDPDRRQLIIDHQRFAPFFFNGDSDRDS